MNRVIPERVDALRLRALSEIKAGHLPSCQFALAMDGKVLVNETLGEATPDSRYVLFSATKPIVASVVWQMVAQGLLDYTAPIATYWPEFARNGKDQVTLDHVLLHTAGFPRAMVGFEVAGDRAARVAQMESWTLEWAPGAMYEYHALSAHWVLSELITRRLGVDHREAVRGLLHSLGLDRVELGTAVENQTDIARVQYTMEQPTSEALMTALGTDKMPESPVSDLRVFATPAALEAGVPGGGGVSDASQVALFYQALLHNPNGVWQSEILHDGTSVIHSRLTDPTGTVGLRTRGLEIAGDDASARFRVGSGVTPPNTFGHRGAGGQLAWADPTTGLSFAFLTNGIDRDFIRESRRSRDLTALAYHCVA
ncbi:serine hydrolase domain-containing protein [Streptomyces fractus]|uniref:serine hydrolase domain-containing protein n=1 Tax=Streptomyces fractus TaxID=641806 RepID=UPI003CEF1517